MRNGGAQARSGDEGGYRSSARHTQPVQPPRCLHPQHDQLGFSGLKELAADDVLVADDAGTSSLLLDAEVSSSVSSGSVELSSVSPRFGVHISISCVSMLYLANPTNFSRDSGAYTRATWSGRLRRVCATSGISGM